MTFYLIAYYYQGEHGFGYSVLENGTKNTKDDKVQGNATKNLVDAILLEMNHTSPDNPVGFINMVPEHITDETARRVAPGHEKVILESIAGSIR